MKLVGSQRLVVMLAEGDAPPQALTLPLTKAGELRYGENPHQKAAFYTDQSLAEAGRGGVASATQHHGKEVQHVYGPVSAGHLMVDPVDCYASLMPCAS